MASFGIQFGIHKLFRRSRETKKLDHKLIYFYIFPATWHGRFQLRCDVRLPGEQLRCS